MSIATEIFELMSGNGTDFSLTEKNPGRLDSVFPDLITYSTLIKGHCRT